QLLRVRGEVKLAPEHPGLDLHGAITAVSEPGNHLGEVGKKENINAGVSREFLFEAEISRLLPEVAFLQKLQLFLVAVEEVRTGNEALDAVHDQVHIVQLGVERAEEVCRDAACGPVEYGRKLSQGN